MPYMTLATARTRVSRLLSDRNKKRWTDAIIDESLKTALSITLREYADNSGSRFEEAITDQPDANGYIDLSSYDPLQISAVAVLRDGQWFQVEAIDKWERGRTPQGVTSNTYRCLVIRNPALPTDDSHPLVGVGATALHSTMAIDELICLRAALNLTVEDKEKRPDLESLRDEYLRTMLHERPQVTSLPFPTARGDISALRYCWDAVNQRIEICQADVL